MTVTAFQPILARSIDFSGLGPSAQSVVAFRDSSPRHSMSRDVASLSGNPWVPVSGKMQNVDVKRGIYIYTFVHWWIKGGLDLGTVSNNGILEGARTSDLLAKPPPTACRVPPLTRRPQGE